MWQGDPVPIRSGLPRFNLAQQIADGLQPGRPLLIRGNRRQGKSSLANAVVENLKKQIPNIGVLRFCVGGDRPLTEITTFVEKMKQESRSGVIQLDETFNLIHDTEDMQKYASAI